MSLPPFTDDGDLPEGVYPVTLADVDERFGRGGERRQAVFTRLQRIHDLARRSGGQDRIIVFGSFVAAQPDPNDVDVVLVLRDEFAPVAGGYRAEVERMQGKMLDYLTVPAGTVARAG